ncbi:MAG: hypothetical protein N4A57_14900 [Anaeromicrobium sp.]|jgi:uncharacterized Rmd1/YagE family protein|uniref:hypothetical protein n=1 Tax=Anaeromicrobium sp. TaxID=1929132 RepID=UPI0025F5A332|nr:hypothetical protein [Anaeromicrobium sp.]MCT4595535.1 hypothetical protein [Anaeromicrobium sp.]
MKDLKKMKKKLERVAKQYNTSNKDMEKFNEMADKYKDKSEAEIENEMMKMINKFSTSEKNQLIKKMKLLKKMGLLDREQEKKLDYFIKLMRK